MGKEKLTEKELKFIDTVCKRKYDPFIIGLMYLILAIFNGVFIGNVKFWSQQVFNTLLPFTAAICFIYLGFIRFKFAKIFDKLINK